MAVTLDVPAVTRTAIALGPDEVQAGDTYIDAPAVTRQAVAYGGSIRSDDAAVASPGDPQSIDITAALYGDDNTTLIDAAVTRIRGTAEWQDDPDRVGLGSITVPTRDSTEVTAADTLSEGRCLQFSFRGEPAWTGRILAPELDVEQTRHQGDKRRTIRVADLRSLLGDCKVRPAGGAGALPTSDLRSFAWYTAETSTASWLNAIEQQIVVSYSWRVPNTDPPWFTPWLPPDGWPVSTTPVIRTTYERTHTAKRGLLRYTYTVPSDGMYQMWVAAFFGAKIYVDGLKVGESLPEPANMWQEPFVTEPFWLTAGDHIFAVDLTKPALTDYSSTAPGTLGTVNQEHCMAFNLHRLNAGDRTIIGDSTVVLKSSSAWKRLHAPTVDPAPTYGTILRTLCDEGIARDSLPAGLAYGFTATHDSNGVAWPNPGVTTVRVSDTVQDVAEQFGELGYHTRFRLSGLTLDAYAPDSAGTHTGVDVSTLRRERSTRPSRPNTLLVSYAAGQFEVQDTAAVTAAGRAIEDNLALADVPTEAAATAIAEAKLATFALEDQSVQVEVNMAPSATAVAPYVAYRPLDWVDISVSEEARVARLTVSEDESGMANIVPDLHSSPESAAKRLDASLARGVPGALGGESRTATPTRWLDSGIQGGFATRYSISPFSTTDVVDFVTDPVRGRSTGEVFDRAVRLTRLSFTSVGEVTDTVTVAMMKNGAQIDTLTLLPGINNTVWLAMMHTFRANDELWFKVTDAGDGAYLLSIQVVAVPASPAQVRPTGRLPWN
jgi:hypothetical protein